MLIYNYNNTKMHFIAKFNDDPPTALTHIFMQCTGLIILNRPICHVEYRVIAYISTYRDR